MYIPECTSGRVNIRCLKSNFLCKNQRKYFLRAISGKYKSYRRPAWYTGGRSAHLNCTVNSDYRSRLWRPGKNNQDKSSDITTDGGTEGQCIWYIWKPYLRTPCTCHRRDYNKGSNIQIYWSHIQGHKRTLLEGTQRHMLER